MKLGPETYGEEGLYQYSLVTNPSRTFNYVLARDVEYFNAVRVILMKCVNPRSTGIKAQNQIFISNVFLWETLQVTCVLARKMTHFKTPM